MDRSGHSRPSTGSNEGMNTDLLVRSINYHGQQLTGFLQEKPVFRNLDLGALDYHLYHQRSKELRMEDRGRRMLLHRFISQGVGGLFDARPQLPPPPAQVPPSVISDGNGTDLTSVLPPMETFLMVDKEDRTRHFFETISEGDVLFARVAAKNNSGLMLTVLAFAGPTSKSRCVSVRDRVNSYAYGRYLRLQIRGRRQDPLLLPFGRDGARRGSRGPQPELRV